MVGMPVGPVRGDENELAWRVSLMPSGGVIEVPAPTANRKRDSLPPAVQVLLVNVCTAT